MESLKESKRPLSNMETMLKSAIITKKHLNDKVTDRWEYSMDIQKLVGDTGGAR